MTFEMTVTVSARSGLRNAYRSVLSAVGSSEIDGASRWLEAVPADGAGPRTVATTATAASASSATVTLRIVVLLPATARVGRSGGRRRGTFASRAQAVHPNG